MDIDFIISKINGFDVSGLESFQQVDLLNRSEGPIVIELLKKSQENSSSDIMSTSHKNKIVKSPQKLKTPSPPSLRRDSVTNAKDDKLCLDHYSNSNYPDSTYSSLGCDMAENSIAEDMNEQSSHVYNNPLDEYVPLNENYDVEYEVIDLHKSRTNEKLGFTLFYLEKGDENTLIFVSQIDCDGLAFKDSRLQEGDQILKINDLQLTSKQMAMEALQQKVLDIRIEIARPKLINRDLPLEYLNDDYIEQAYSGFKLSNAQCLDPLIEILEEEAACCGGENYGYPDTSDGVTYRHNVSQLSPRLNHVTSASPSILPPNYAHESSSLSSGGSRCVSYRSGEKDSGLEEIKLTWSSTEDDEDLDEKTTPYHLHHRCQGNRAPAIGPPLSSGVKAMGAAAKVPNFLASAVPWAAAAPFADNIYEDPNELLVSRNREPAFDNAGTAFGDRDEYDASLNHDYESLVGGGGGSLDRAPEHPRSGCVPNTPKVPYYYRTGWHMYEEDDGLSIDTTKMTSSDPEIRERNSNGASGSVGFIGASFTSLPDDIGTRHHDKQLLNNINNSKNLHRNNSDYEMVGSSRGDSSSQRLKVPSKRDKPTPGTVEGAAYPDVMYTNRQNLQHTMALQQLLFKKAMGSGSSTLPLPTTSRVEQMAQISSRDDTDGTEDTKMKWKVKRRSDGSRYIVRRPVTPKPKDNPVKRDNLSNRTRIPNGDKLLHGTSSNKGAMLDNFSTIQGILLGRGRCEEEKGRRRETPGTRIRNNKQQFYPKNTLLTVTTV